jgi:hypothetical protein
VAKRRAAQGGQQLKGCRIPARSFVKAPAELRASNCRNLVRRQYDNPIAKYAMAGNARDPRQQILKEKQNDQQEYDLPLV